MKRASWKSKLGFIFAAAGSAVGLANIWRFPYIVGQYGGAAFICIYLVCLFLIGFPVFISEVLIGRTAQKNPAGAFKKLGGDSFWTGSGLFTVITGFIISSFYSVIAGWVLGYLIASIGGLSTHFSSLAEVQSYFKHLVGNPVWGLAFHLIFMVLCFGLLFLGVRKGLERGSKILVPFLIVILIALVISGLSLPGSEKGLAFYFKPNWSLITPTTFLIALGHSFFTLSLGQGTMVTYGSYLSPKDNIPKSCFPIALIDTFIALLAGMAIFPIVFSVGLSPDEGAPLIFYTLPLAFSQLKGGYIFAILFFLLLTLAAITSQISALEPLIAYLMDEKKWRRKKAVIFVCLTSFLLGIPMIFSNFVAHKFLVFGHSLWDLVSMIALDIMVPIGGFLALILIAWRWGFKKAYHALKEGTEGLFERNILVKGYFWLSLKFTAPLLVILIFLKAIGLF
ncbi:MAG: hypothetical protein S4CHLAM7_04280 [Chlamydiae bacterium]|nr:hypothetical protein [Chlamydiota bacterium]